VCVCVCVCVCEVFKGVGVGCCVRSCVYVCVDFLGGVLVCCVCVILTCVPPSASPITPKHPCNNHALVLLLDIAAAHHPTLQQCALHALLHQGAGVPDWARPCLCIHHTPTCKCPLHHRSDAHFTSRFIEALGYLRLGTPSHVHPPQTAPSHASTSATHISRRASSRRWGTCGWVRPRLSAHHKPTPSRASTAVTRTSRRASSRRWGSCVWARPRSWRMSCS